MLYRVSKCNFLRDCRSKLVDLCLNIWLIFLLIIYHVDESLKGCLTSYIQLYPTPALS